MSGKTGGCLGEIPFATTFNIIDAATRMLADATYLGRTMGLSCQGNLTNYILKIWSKPQRVSHADIVDSCVEIQEFKCNNFQDLVLLRCSHGGKDDGRQRIMQTTTSQAINKEVDGNIEPTTDLAKTKAQIAKDAKKH